MLPIENNYMTFVLQWKRRRKKLNVRLLIDFVLIFNCVPILLFFELYGCVQVMCQVPKPSSS